MIGERAGRPAAAKADAHGHDAHHDCKCAKKEQAAKPAGGDCGCHGKAARSQATEAAVKKEEAAPKSVAEMTPAEKLAYNQAKRDRIFGKFENRN